MIKKILKRNQNHLYDQLGQQIWGQANWQHPIK